MVPEIRVAVDADVEAIGRILAQATAYWKGLDPEVFVEVDAEPLAERYRVGKQFPPDVPAEDRCTLVASLDHQVVGFADLTISRPGVDVDIHRPDARGWMIEIAVAENLRGQGIGTRTTHARGSSFGRSLRQEPQMVAATLNTPPRVVLLRSDQLRVEAECEHVLAGAGLDRLLRC